MEELAQLFSTFLIESRAAREADRVAALAAREEASAAREADRVAALAAREADRVAREADRVAALAAREEDRTVRDKHHTETLELLRVLSQTKVSLSEYKATQYSQQAGGSGGVSTASLPSSSSGVSKSASVKQKEGVARDAFADLSPPPPYFDTTALPMSADTLASSSVFAHRILTSWPFSSVNVADFAEGFSYRDDTNTIMLKSDPSGKHGVSFFIVTSANKAVVKAAHECRRVGQAGCTCFPLDKIPSSLSLVVNSVQLKAQGGAPITLHASLGPKEPMSADSFMAALASWSGAAPCGIYGAADAQETWSSTNSESSWGYCDEDEKVTDESEEEGETTPPSS
jgi:hypothetical protein